MSNNNKKLFILLLFISSFFSGYEVVAEPNKHIDSLIKSIRSSIEQNKDLRDETDILVNYFSNNEPLEGIKFFSELLLNKSIKKSNFNLSLIYSSIAKLYAKIDRFDKAASFYNLSSFYASKNNSLGIVAWNTLDIGNLYFQHGNDEFARKEYHRAIAIADSFQIILKKNVEKNRVEINGLNHLLLVATENIGMCYQNLKVFDSAYIYFTKYAHLRKNRKNQINLQYFYLIMSKFFLVSNKIDSAIIYAKNALNVDTSTFENLIDKSEYQLYLINSYLILSKAFFLKKHLDSSIFYQIKCFNQIEDNKSNIQKISAYWDLSSFYLANKEYSKSLNFIEKGKSFLEQDAEFEHYNTNFDYLLVEIYIKKGDYSKASKIQSKLIETLDSTNIKIRSQNISLSGIDLQLQENIDKIKSLEEDNKLQKVKIEAQKTTNLLYILLTSAFLIILIILYYVYINKKKNLQTISSKNIQLNEMNNKLQESIRIKDEINIELTASQHELIRINENLELANSTKNKLFSIIAHDLKNAVGGLKGLNQMLNDDYDSFDEEEKRQLINMMNNSSIEMYRLLENLLLWSRTQRNQIHPNKERNIPYQICVNNFGLYQRQIEEKKLGVATSILPDFSFVFDANMLDTIIRNLLNNAIKYSNENGTIDIAMQVKDNFVQFSVADNGVGMTPEKAAHIFSSDTATSTVGTKGEKGTGLGLMVCYDFVKLHNGNIWFESEEGQGTTAYFTFEYLKS